MTHISGIRAHRQVEAALVQLPAPGCTFPKTSRASVVVIGGERCDEAPFITHDVRLLALLDQSPPLVVLIAGGFNMCVEIPQYSALRRRTDYCRILRNIAEYRGTAISVFGWQPGSGPRSLLLVT